VTIRERIFLVGCPRSGTTLLQSVVASHPEVASFPESHFFAKLLEKRKLWERKLDLNSKEIHKCIDDFLAEVNHKELKNIFPKHYAFAFQFANSFKEVLDILAEMQDKEMWLEKTPRHLHYISEIERWINEAKFIHVIRQGQDVVASMYEVTNKYPELWSGTRSIEKCINRWINDIDISRKYIHQSNHIIISYEQITDDYESVLKILGKFIGTSFDPNILRGRELSTRNIVLKNEPWKESVNQPIRSKKSEKFYQVFSQDEQKIILDKISDVNTEIFSEMLNSI